LGQVIIGEFAPLLLHLAFELMHRVNKISLVESI
jgi:hypothetical protein